MFFILKVKGFNDIKVGDIALKGTPKITKGITMLTSWNSRNKN
jgi:hypothetical protein